MSTTYNGNASNASAQIAANQVTITVPQDGDSFTAAEDNARTNNLADLMQAVIAPFAAAYSWAKAQTFTLLATFSAGFTSSAGPNTMGSNTTIAAPSPTTLSAGSNWVFTGGSNFAKFWQDALGVVHVEAQGTCTTAGAEPFGAAPFPVGMRPPGTIALQAFRVASGGAIGSGTAAAIPLPITSAGNTAVAAYMSNGDTFYVSGSFSTI